MARKNKQGYFIENKVVKCSKTNIDYGKFIFDAKSLEEYSVECLFPFQIFTRPQPYTDGWVGKDYNYCIPLTEPDRNGNRPDKNKTYCPIGYPYKHKKSNPSLNFFDRGIEDKSDYFQHFGVCGSSCPSHSYARKVHRIGKDHPSGGYGQIRKCQKDCRFFNDTHVTERRGKRSNQTKYPFTKQGYYCKILNKEGKPRWGHCICEKPGCYLKETLGGISFSSEYVIAPICSVSLLFLAFLIFICIKRKGDIFAKQTNNYKLETFSEHPDVVRESTNKPQKYEKMKMLRELKHGNTIEINPDRLLNDQPNAIPYVPKKEIERTTFKVGKILGSGNFGTVFKGEAIGLFYPKSKTYVAIKTVSNTSNEDDINALVCEIKILSNLDLHCNLVNLVGACTSQLETNGEIWLLLELCDKGDLKDFLLKHRQEFQEKLTKKGNDIDNRLLLTWSYDVAKGMEYLASKNVMHGDLAARNVLISSEKNSKGEILVAKVADFGLSKQLYENSYYRKVERNYVPWKWMAYEFLQDGAFQRKSDVWSYGVVVWELFSLGKSPYGGQTYDEVFKRLGEGYRLPCPDNIKEIKTWPAEEIYSELSSKCFALSVENRSTFSEVASFIESKMNEMEKKTYRDVETRCKTKNSLLLVDKATKSSTKRETMMF